MSHIKQNRTQVGALLADLAPLSSSSSAAASPEWCALLDAFHQHKCVFMCTPPSITITRLY
jgi:hypothetical protein